MNSEEKYEKMNVQDANKKSNPCFATEKSGCLLVLIIVGISFIIAPLILYAFFGIMTKITFTKTSCEYFNSNVQGVYDCSYYCDPTIYVDSVVETTCEKILIDFKEKNPDLCQINSTYCIPDQTYCNGGYFCCQEKCTDVYSCETTIKENCLASKYPCSTHCEIKQNCQCLSFTDKQQCIITCEVDYIANIEFAYDLDQNVEFPNDFVGLEKTDRIISNLTHHCSGLNAMTCANDWIKKFPLNVPFQCSYYKSNPYNIVFETPDEGLISIIVPFMSTGIAICTICLVIHIYLRLFKSNDYVEIKS